MIEELNFTKARIEGLPTPKPKENGNTGEQWYKDSNKHSTPKLQLRVSSTGVKTWYYVVKVDGRASKLRLGAYPDLNPLQAREARSKTAGEISQGENPQQVKADIRARELQDNTTLRDALKMHLSNRGLRPKTRDGYKQCFSSKTNGLSSWLDKPLTFITRKKFTDWYKARLKATKSGAMLESRYLRAVINTAIESAKENGVTLLPDGNPCAGLGSINKKRKIKLKPRKGYIRPTDMPVFLGALDSLSSIHPSANFDTARDYLRFLLFSGCRIEETASLQRTDIDIKRRVFILRETKNREDDVELPLNHVLLEIVERRLAKKSAKYLFTDVTGKKPFGRPAKALTALQKSSGITFTPHDLRRTFRTVAAKVKLPMKTGMMLVNHKVSGDLAVDLNYIIVEEEELLEASDQVAKEILRQSKLEKI